MHESEDTVIRMRDRQDLEEVSSWAGEERTDSRERADNIGK